MDTYICTNTQMNNLFQGIQMYIKCLTYSFFSLRCMMLELVLTPQVIRRIDDGIVTLNDTFPILLYF